MKKIFRRDNIAIHLLALVLALALWFFVKSTSGPVRQGDTNSRRFAGVTIETRNRGTELDLVRPITQTTVLNVRAHQDVLDRLTVQDLVAYVDLRTLKEGTHDLNIRVDLPAGVEVLSASPARVQVALEQIISTQVPVTLSLTGAPPAGYYAPLGAVEPASVIVTGGRSVVGSLAPFIIVLDVSTLTDTASASVQLEPFNTQGQLLGLSVNPPQVQYRQPIYPTKLVPLEVVGEGGYAPGIQNILFESNIPALEVAANSELLQEIESIVLSVDTSEVLEDTTIEITPQLPQGAHFVAPSNVEVRMIVRR